MDLKQTQERIIENKVKKGFNTTNIEKEFCLLYGEVGEAYEAFRKKKDDLGGELADVAIYLLGIAEILGFNMEDEINKKLKINEDRVYVKINGVNHKVENKEDK